DRVAVDRLEALATKAGRPQTRMQALCTLDGLGALRPEVVRAALKDVHPGVRRHAIRLAERLLDKSPDLGPQLLALVTDADPQVRLQLAFTLGAWRDPRAADALGTLAVTAGDDPYLTAAVLSSATKDNLRGVLRAVL